MHDTNSVRELEGEVGCKARQLSNSRATGKPPWRLQPLCDLLRQNKAHTGAGDFLLDTTILQVSLAITLPRFMIFCLYDGSILTNIPRLLMYMMAHFFFFSLSEPLL